MPSCRVEASCLPLSPGNQRSYNGGEQLRDQAFELERGDVGAQHDRHPDDGDQDQATLEAAAPEAPARQGIALGFWPDMPECGDEVCCLGDYQAEETRNKQDVRDVAHGSVGCCMRGRPLMRCGCMGLDVIMGSLKPISLYCG